MNVLLLFLDGVGIGKNNPDANPFLVAQLPALRSLFGGEIPTVRNRFLTGQRAVLLPLDATLGMPGLPQSGTGQTALFTGVNAARVVGRHFGPHPYSTLRPVIREKSIFRELLRAGKRPWFANTFPQRFFDYATQHSARLSVTALSCQYAGIQLLRAEDLKVGRGVSADITNAGWRALGYPDIAPIDPGEAGRRLVRMTDANDFVLFEFWRTDYAGHSRDMKESVHVLETFDAMLAGVLDQLHTRKSLPVITSDHGNIEDLTTRTHTRNPVPLILFGHRHSDVARDIQGKSHRMASLCRVTPSLLRFLTHTD